MGFLLTETLLLVAFGLIYLAFLLYDLLKRGDNKGSIAYVVALLPANYLWYIVAKNGMGEFGMVGAMTVLVSLWLLAIIRDIYLKDRAQGYKDADDVALMLIIGLILQIIVSAILPAIPANAAMQNGTIILWKYFYLPNFADATVSVTIVLVYKIIVTLDIIAIIIPTVTDLRDAKISISVILILTLIFTIPFGYLAFLWAYGLEAGMVWVLLFLFSVVFFIFLMLITRGTEK
ncbi:MAG: hypothetical protein ACTSWW_11170 [Promethearchaeota archaeon]